jgi:hypothetical protein
MKSIVRILAGVILLAGTAPAAEVTSNGTGGGRWSEPGTWRGKAVPKPEDEVILRKGDVIVFDRTDDGNKITCAKLFLDPQSMLKYQTGAGKITLSLTGPIESYGAIRMDATENATDQLELRLMGKTVEDRTLKLAKGGSLLAAGKDKLPQGKRNVVLTSFIPFDTGDHTGHLTAGAGCSVDVQGAEVENFYVQTKEIDNTGARAGERLNILRNRFTGRSALQITSCDTPVIADNSFEWPGPAVLQMSAVRLDGCPLAEVKNNTVRGPYSSGILGYGQSDGVTTGNVVEKCTIGIYWVGQDSMLKGNTVRDCTTGIFLPSTSGVLEEIEIDKCSTGIYAGNATVQLTTIQIRNVPKDGVPIDFAAGELTLLNCDLKPEQIRLPKPLPKTEKPLVTAMQFLVVGVKGEVPENTQVEVQTVNPNPPIAPGAADLNIRNAPAPLVKGLTPLPQTLSPLVVRAWQIDKGGKVVAAPEYHVKVLAPAEKEGEERKVLKMVTVKPEGNWFRPKPNEATPTVEVSLK